VRYINYGKKEKGSPNEYRIALVDHFGIPLIWYRGFYYHKRNEFVLYPEKVVVCVSAEHITKLTVDAYSIKHA